MDAGTGLTGNATVKVPYQDADPGGVVWHGNYFRYFDTARCDLLDKIDYGYTRMAESGFHWPIVDAQIRFVQAARFDDELFVEARLVESEYRLKIAYIVRNAEGKCITRGHTVQVAVDMATEELCLGSPAALMDRLAAWQKAQRA